MVEIRFFKKTEKDILLKAIDTLWCKNHIYVRNPEVMDHLVLNTPWEKDLISDDEYPIVGMWLDGKIVGLQGVMPQEANICGKTVKAQTGTIWIVERQKGYSLDGLMMDSFAQKILQPQFYLAIGLSQKCERIHRLQDEYVYSDMPRWVIVCQQEKMKEVFNINESAVKYLPVVKKKWHCGKNRIVCDEMDWQKWDEYYDEVVAPRTMGICRDSKFLRWRYLESPILKYHFITVKGEKGNYLGLAVVRIEKILDGKFSIGRILEYISFDVEGSLQLASAILDYNGDVLFWDFYCLSDVTSFGLEMVGFQKIPSWNDKYIVPTRFKPIDYNVTKINVAIQLSEELKSEVGFEDLRKWYVTKSDGDQDRAN